MPPSAQTPGAAGLKCERAKQHVARQPWADRRGLMTSQDGSAPAARPGPLAGLLVADFSRILAGPYCTMLLADLGADVVKVESPAGDDTRAWMPPVHEGVSTYYLAVNRNKRAIALDLKDETDKAAAQELVRRADIVIENFKPGGLRRFGLDYETAS